MANPWLEIPAHDYLSHMGSPNVLQAQFLDEHLQTTLQMETVDPKDITILGCSTGRGLEYIDFKKTTSLTVVDINSDYLDKVKQNRSLASQCNIIQADLSKDDLAISNQSLIFARLLFEYLEPSVLLEKISRWLEKGGILSVVLQIEAKGLPEVSETQYKSLEKLSSIMKLVSPDDLVAEAEQWGLQEIASDKITLQSGKPFYIGYLQKNN